MRIIQICRYILRIISNMYVKNCVIGILTQNHIPRFNLIIYNHILYPHCTYNTYYVK